MTLALTVRVTVRVTCLKASIENFECPTLTLGIDFMQLVDTLVTTCVLLWTCPAKWVTFLL
jgi:hypothetical protein